MLMHNRNGWQMIYRPDTGEILGVHILGLHAADLIHEASNAIAMGNTIKVRTSLCRSFPYGVWASFRLWFSILTVFFLYTFPRNPHTVPSVPMLT